VKIVPNEGLKESNRSSVKEESDRFWCKPRVLPAGNHGEFRGCVLLFFSFLSGIVAGVAAVVVITGTSTALIGWLVWGRRG
jgi:hypothetical protein